MCNELNHENISSGKKVSTREMHYKTATVGRDTIENAEYFTFDHTWLWEPKKMKWYEKIWDVLAYLRAPYLRSEFVHEVLLSYPMMKNWIP